MADATASSIPGTDWMDAVPRILIGPITLEQAERRDASARRREERRQRLARHPARESLPEPSRPVPDDFHELELLCSCHVTGHYPSLPPGEARLRNEAARALLAESGEIRAVWSINGWDATTAWRIMDHWAEATQDWKPGSTEPIDVAIAAFPHLSRNLHHALADQLRRRGQRSYLRAMPARHRTVHRVADNQGGWTCHYCNVGLIDVCADDDVLFDEQGGRYINPDSPKRPPTLDHVIPQALGGSNGLRNLVLACHSCNSRKNAA
jgi:hypothetical protein